MPIPLPNLPTVQDTPIGAPPVNADAAAAGARGLSGLSQSISEVSGHFFDHAMRLQDIENSRKIAEARNSLQEAYAKHRIDLESDMDPASRMAKTQAFLSAAKQSLIPADAPPAVVDKLTAHYEEFATQASIAQAQDSHNLEIRRAKQASENELEMAVVHGRRDMAEAAIINMGSWTTPEEQTAIRRRVEEKFKARDEEQALNSYQQTIDADPIAAERDLEKDDFSARNPALPPEKIAAVRRYATQKANSVRAEFFDGLIIDGTADLMGEDEWKTLAEIGMVDSGTHAKMVARLRTAEANREPLFSPQVYEEAWGHVATYDPAKDPTKSQLAYLRASLSHIPLPKEAVATLNAILTDRTTPDKNPKNPLEAEFAGRITTLFGQGEFGKFRVLADTDNNPATPPAWTTNKAANAAAWSLRGRFADAWRKELATLPDTATFPEVEARFNALLDKVKTQRPVPLVSVPAAPSVTWNPLRTLNPTGGDFGGIPTPAPGTPFPVAEATVFGGSADPDDNGINAVGKKTGPGGVEGVAIPKKILDQQFPGTSKEWRAQNIAVVIRAGGKSIVSPWADYGTAESVWEREGKPVLDLTEGVAKKLGGTPIYKDGKLRALSGIPDLKFAIVSTATAKPLKGMPQSAVRDSWWEANKAAVSDHAAETAIAATLERWAIENSK